MNRTIWRSTSMSAPFSASSVSATVVVIVIASGQGLVGRTSTLAGLTTATLAGWPPQQDFASATATMMAKRADALLIGDSQVSYVLRKEIADFATQQRLPAMVANRSELTGGALMSYGPDLAENWRKGAAYVAKILNGAKPAELPVQRPTKVELLTNLIE